MHATENGNLKNLVLDCLGEIGLDGADVELSADLEDDLGLDSVEQVELVALVLQRAGLATAAVPPGEVRSLDDLMRRVSAASSAAAAEAT
jgi:acyl carrier protein